MTILYVDDVVDGHHIPYLNRLIQDTDNKCILLNSKKVDGLCLKQYVTDDWPTKSIKRYYRFICQIKKIAKREKVDIIHFLTMDSFVRFFGIGLSILSQYNLLGTFHKFPEQSIKQYSIKLIYKKLDCVVVHSGYLAKQFKELGVKSCKAIEYPCFGKYEIKSEDARKLFGINNAFPVIGCIGETRYDKGLDILLDSLKRVSGNYNLLISGKASYYSSKYIEEKTKHIKNKILNLQYLTDEEFGASIIASDYIVLPYRRIFNGASGPLSEGVFYNKVIIGPNFGNIGYLINKYDLGFLFICENSASLGKSINNAINSKFSYNNNYMKYQTMLSPKSFSNQYHYLYSKMRITNDKNQKW